VCSETRASPKTKSRRWIERISTRCRQHPLLTTAVIIYVSLTAIEITRNLILADPLDKNDVGFSRWEEIPAPNGSNTKLLFRWSEPSSTLDRPVEGTVLGLTLYRPDDAEGEIDVAFMLDGEPLDAYTISVGGTYSFRYYLPAILSPGTWTEIQARWAERARDEAERAAGGWFANWQELKPWSLPRHPLDRNRNQTDDCSCIAIRASGLRKTDRRLRHRRMARCAACRRRRFPR